MIQDLIMDAASEINMFSLNQEQPVFSIVGAISLLKVVSDKIYREACKDQRFAKVSPVADNLPEHLFETLDDEITTALASVVPCITYTLMQQRVQ